MSHGSHGSRSKIWPWRPCVIRMPGRGTVGMAHQGLVGWMGHVGLHWRTSLVTAPGGRVRARLWPARVPATPDVPAALTDGGALDTGIRL